MWGEGLLSFQNYIEESMNKKVWRPLLSTSAQVNFVQVKCIENSCNNVKFDEIINSQLLERQKAKEKRKDIPISLQSSKE